MNERSSRLDNNRDLIVNDGNRARRGALVAVICSMFALTPVPPHFQVWYQRTVGLVAIMRKSLIACVFASTLAASAQAADVDWKMYGTTSKPDRGLCFYEGKGLVVAQPTLRVWTKCLSQKDLDSVDFDSELGKKIIENALRKVTDIYVPPIALVEDINFDQTMEVVGYEETANLSNIHPQASIFYELNCSERMMRRLSTHVLVNGKDRSDDKPSSWEYVPPEGNAARLLKILCPR